MPAEEVSCPRCGAEQKFAPNERIGDDGIIEIYIKCHKCRLTKVIDHTTPMLKQARKRELRWVKRAAAEKLRHGSATATTAKKLQQAISHRTGLQAELATERKRRAAA